MLLSPKFVCRAVFICTSIPMCLLAQAPPPQPKPLIPDTFTNLKVLPKDISKPDLIRTMKGFTNALGVRCMFCHDTSDDLTQGDLSTDQKPTKLTARIMIQMVDDINNVHLKKVATAKTEVTCKTCHDGHSKPPNASPRESNK